MVRYFFATLLVWLTALIALAARVVPAPRVAAIGVSGSGHFVTFNGRTLLLLGESGTQAVMQNVNIDYRQWIDDCASRGIRGVHIWSFVAPRQKQDGSVVESRYGYVYPGITPWARTTGGAKATDLGSQWDLQTFDEGPAGDGRHYWPRLRDLCGYAKHRNMVVGITVFFGWPKWNTPQRPDWSYHPLNTVNGGPVADTGHLVTRAQLIALPGTEIWPRTWQTGWSSREKTQWIWERFCKKLIDDLGPFGNVFFVFMDEHSYSEGNGGDHFLRFFTRRGQPWADWDKRRPGVTFVCSDTLHQTDKNEIARVGFRARPKRPYVCLEGPPYRGDRVRTSIWTFALGGGHFFFHADEGQETVTTGIMGYDPNVPGGNKGMDKRDWIGHASRFFNEHVAELDTLVPHNTLCQGGTYCLADPGREYVVYSKFGAPVHFAIDLRAAHGSVTCRFYNPRSGRFGPPFQGTGDTRRTFTKPDSKDWILHLTATP